MTYQYTQDCHYDKWATVADTMDVYLEELEEDDTQDVFLSVPDFDLDEVL